MLDAQDDAFELAIESAIPENLRKRKNGNYARVRYEVRVGLLPATGEVSLLAEALWLKPDAPDVEHGDRDSGHCSPRIFRPPESVVAPARRHTPRGGAAS